MTVYNEEDMNTTQDKMNIHLEYKDNMLTRSASDHVSDLYLY